MVRADGKSAGLGAIAPLAMAVLIAAGCSDFDKMATVLQLMSGDRVGLSVLFVAAVMAPLLPLLGLTLHYFAGLNLPARAVDFLAILTTFLGLAMTAVGFAFAAAGGLIVLIEGIALTVAVAATFRLMCRADGDPRANRAALAFLAASSAVAIWSLVAAAVIMASASRLSDGRPYCLARHGDKQAVESLAALRGLSFYTTRSNYKSTSNWYLHGILIVETASPPEIYNWSPRHLRFDRLSDPRRLVEDPSSNCRPQPNFLSTLPLL